MRFLSFMKISEGKLEEIDASKKIQKVKTDRFGAFAKLQKAKSLGLEPL